MQVWKILLAMCKLLKMSLTPVHMWQSRIEIEHYSIAQFDCITMFEAL